MSWQFYAVVSAIAAGATAILAKVGLEGVPSNLATAVRTAMVLVLAIESSSAARGRASC